jgi:hypothetical protein
MLLISGDNLDADEVTRLLGVTPTETAKAGDCRGWRVSSALQVRSANVERHIHWILDRITEKKGVIQQLRRQKNCQVDLGCWWQGHPEADEVGPFLTPETLQRVADFDLNLIFYFLR